MTLEQFETFRSQFRTTRLYLDMLNTVEDSPWHREDNVAVHTDMVVDEYLNSINIDQFGMWWHGAIAALFHDVGKPIAEETKQSEQRGTYRSYANHELLSARICEDYLLCNTDIEIYDIFRICWMIQFHLPYKITKRDKVQNIYNTVEQLGILDQFTKLLISDQRGRTSDNHQDNINGVEQWISELRGYQVQQHEPDGVCPTLTLLIGPSSAGKSTFTKEILQFEPYTIVYSWDELRLQWYGDQNEPDPEKRYNDAFWQSCNDSEFMNKAQKEFIDIIKQGKSVIVDNTNLSSKRRRFFVSEARKKGYTINGVVMMITREELLNRASARPDRNLDPSIIINMHESLAYPTYGECDNIFLRAT